MVNATDAKTIVIVGGGTAGWMTAALLSKAYEGARSRPISITLIESEEVPPIGVGEATIHTMRAFLESCGVSEGKFMHDCDATLKHGILFQDWGVPEDPGQRHRFFHPFELAPAMAPEPVEMHWLNARAAGLAPERYDQWAGIQSAMAAANRSPKSMNDAAFNAAMPYGYHFDANKVAHFLKDASVRRGVTHVLGHIEDVTIVDRQKIEAVTLKDGRTVAGDLFIDCTGFARVVHSKLDDTFLSYKDRLFVDRAMTMRLPRPDDGYAPRPYTTATARSAGWTFEIDLAERQGLGLIYSSRHQTDDEAEHEFRKVFELEDADLPLRKLQFESGRVAEPWKGNCIAQGLSYGFLEPLESTGLYFAELSARFMIDYLHFDAEDCALKDAFNTGLNSSFDNTTDFVVLHYILSNRTDTPFWKDVSTTTQVSARLKTLLSLWEEKAPTDSDFVAGGLPFGPVSYAHIVYGMGRVPITLPESIRHLDPDDSAAFYQEMRKIQAQAIANTPTHADFLQKYTAAFS